MSLEKQADKWDAWRAAAEAERAQSARLSGEALELLRSTHAALVELWQRQPEGYLAQSIWVAACDVKEALQRCRRGDP